MTHSDARSSLYKLERGSTFCCFRKKSVQHLLKTTLARSSLSCHPLTGMECTLFSNFYLKDVLQQLQCLLYCFVPQLLQKNNTSYVADFGKGKVVKYPLMVLGISHFLFKKRFCSRLDI